MSAPIGIIGSACRFPGQADSPSKLWSLLNHPQDVLSTFPADRLSLEGFYHPNGEHHGSTDVQNKGYLLTEDTRLFDASFFNISPAEADEMDPQHRVLLETVYEALEAAGCPIDQVQGSLTSVYAGLMNGDYQNLQWRDLETLPTYNATGTARSILSNRISYFFDLRGPSMTIDTACSSSMVALHQAVQSLRSGECRMAIVAGANLILDPTMYIAESKLHMLSPDSRSRMWDNSANGYARGEGFAVVILKLVDQAVADRDHVESVIRGTAVNSDGRTKGITVPSAHAQTALITAAYRDAGLNPLLPQERCQFFEAHGTGTRAGDPVEAQAIRDAFFPPEVSEADPDGKLLVGSIKTVIGHLEGCAGLAGVLKASLAVQKRIVPPNMHFAELNPDIAPFYRHLEIPVESRPWPEVAGQPLRASVNSFGFGGTNAHVVLESFQPEEAEAARDLGLVLVEGEDGEPEQRCVGPLTFSAHSKTSLVGMVAAHAKHMRANNEVKLADLAWTLHNRRSEFGFRTFFSGATRQELLSRMDAYVDDAMAAGPASASAGAMQQLSDDAAILGIFTGQGAQWASMGRHLIVHCRQFRDSIARCEESLAGLGVDAPTWSLQAELVAAKETSRIGEAALSQPLCTAIQIATVDLLKACGVRFRAVVGHSSGEIAAAYAAGILSAHDAIRIAFYRGVHAGLAIGPEGQQGGMMAVGLSFESASAFCAAPKYRGRISVAAENAPTSVTLSGDMEAIDEAKAELDEQKTFARKLAVDTAYHSHHMQPSSAAYLQSLRACNIKVATPSPDCTWVSSVLGDDSLLLEEEDLQALQDQYWVDNLLKPVLFAPAVECALASAGPFDLVLEVGPHPALKGPTTQILKHSLGSALPYLGTMKRDEDETEAFSAVVGYLWAHVAAPGGKAVVDLDGYRQAYMPTSCGSAENVKAQMQPRLVKGLPSYPWDHKRLHWKESRISRNLRLHRTQAVHELLGRRVPDDTQDLMRWRNILRLNEVPWVKGHVFQGQAVLPGASYISLIVDAVKVLAGGQPIELVELFDVTLPKAVILQESKSPELLSTLRLTKETALFLAADFSFHVVNDDAQAAPELTCSGRVEIHILAGGSASSNAKIMPSATSAPPNLNAVDIERFYSSLLDLGLNYTGPFLGLKSASRTLGYASASASWDAAEIGPSFTVHPAILDVAFHAVFAAFASPSSGQLWTPYLPVGIRRASIAPSLGAMRGSQIDVISAEINAAITASTASSLEGDVQISFGPSGTTQVGVQVEGLQLRATSDPKAKGDRPLLSKTLWEADISAGVDMRGQTIDRDDEDMIDAMERLALHYYQTLLADIEPHEIEGFAWHNQLFLKSAQHQLEVIRTGRHPAVKREWVDDSRETVFAVVDKYKERYDFRLISALGENMPAILRGQRQTLEVMLEDDVLNRFYMEGAGFRMMNEHIARAVGQVTHRYPQAKMLEIGAGTGGTTRKILDSIGDALSEYTYTDISAGFFEKAADKFSDYRSKMVFKTLNIEKDVAEQGFEEGTYDIVVAANVLHATKYLDQTMRNVRRLLKPGGHLILMETTGDLLRIGFMMGSLEGWWFGPQIGDQGRRWGPGILPAQWDALLEDTGFSGVDSIVFDMPNADKHSFSMITSQAVDDTVSLLRDPLSNLDLITPPPHRQILILGGETLPIAKLTTELKNMLAPWNTSVTAATSIDRLDLNYLHSSHVSVISVTELDQPLFAKDMTAERLQKLQLLLGACDNMLWVTAGRNGESPTSNMFVGIGRALWTERSDMNLQFLDTGKRPQQKNSARALATVVVESFLRLVVVPKSPEQHQGNLLWTTEPELALDDEERLLIPRLVLDTRLNERYNAGRRVITKETTTQASDVEIVVSPEGVMSLVGSESVHASQNRTPSGHAILHVRFSCALSLADSKQDGYFLCYGTIGSTSKKAFALSRTNQSAVTIKIADILPLDVQDLTPAREAALVEAVASQMVARSLLHGTNVPTTGRILIYEPCPALARAILACEPWKQREVHFAVSTTESSNVEPAGCIVLHPYALASYVRRQLPSDLTAVVDVSTRGLRPNVKSCLPKGCLITRSCDSSLSFAEAEGKPDSEFLKNLLVSSYANALTAAADSRPAPEPSPVHMLAGQPSSTIAFPVVVSWCSQPLLQVQVRPTDPSGMFSSTKTHLLVGLTGDLGQSICSFMVANGARHMVVASRRGTVDPDWLKTMQAAGANIQVRKMDVTSRASVQAVYDEITTTMPPIGGVCNAAMVLKDKMFMDMDVDTLNKTLRPKVDGSKFLDELFSSSSSPLDYFVLFSSLATMYGNAGQANYHAANMFMTSLVAARRARGLAASVIHVGMVVDAGYVVRAGRKIEDHLRKLFFVPLSEADAHHLFAEGVLASPADSGLEPDICMGVQPFGDHANAQARPPWFSNPRFARFVYQQPDEELEGGEGQQKAGGNALHIRQQLDGAESAEAAHVMVQEAFCAKLVVMMQLEPESVNHNVPLLDLGFDSLLAVEVRTWFLKEMHVDVPILSLLSGDTFDDICLNAATQYLSLREERMGAVLETIQGPTTADDNASVSVEDGEGVDTPDSSSVKSSSGQSQVLESDSGTSNSSTPATTPCEETAEPPLKMPDSLPASTSPPNAGDAAANSESVTVQVPPRAPRSRDTSRVEAMSHAQARLWFLTQYLDDPTTYNMAACYTMKGPLDVERFRTALAKIVAHHAGLRTCFYADPASGEPRQAVLWTATPSFKHTQAATPSDVEREFETLKKREWDLEYGDVFATSLLSENDETHTFIIAYHHIIMDGVSVAILLRDLQQAYEKKPITAPKKQSIDAAVELQASLARGDLREQLTYWETRHAQLPDVTPFLPMAHARNRKPLRRYASHLVTREAGRELATKIKEASRALRITPFHLHLATVQVLFSKLCGVEDLCIGVADANRADDQLANTIGFFLNLLPMRFACSQSLTFAEIARATAGEALGGLRNSRVPFDVILEHLKVPRDAAHSPLFQVAFNYRVGNVADLTLGGECKMGLGAYKDAENPWDIGFGVFQTADGSCSLQITCQNYIYSKEAGELLMDAYVHLLDAVSSDPSSKVADYRLFDEAAVQRGVQVGTGPRVASWDTWPDTLTGRVDAMIKAHGDSAAISDQQGSLTYAQLDGRINTLTTAIEKAGLTRGSRVAVFCQPSADVVISMLAILRLGLVYLPLDTNLPSERHAAILADSKAVLLLCHGETAEPAEAVTTSAGIPRVDLSSLPSSAAAGTTPLIEPDQNEASFLLYTSGSTGTPKGISLSQAGILNHLAAKTHELSLGRETVLQQSSFGFDMSLTQTFCALANGGTLIIVPKSARGDPVALARLMLEHQVTFTIATPSEYLMLLRYGQEWLKRLDARWKHACMGGEAVGRNLLESFAALGNRGLELTNCYGPTETCLAASFNKLSTDPADIEALSDLCPVGKVLPNYSIYIVDEESKPVPLGYPGEICIGGAGVGLGYVNLHDLSAQKFVHNPFAPAQDVARGWTKMFKTGDRGRLTQDGCLIFMGRIEGDTLIKLRGLRIELDDVANTIIMTAGPGILTEAIVTVRGEPEAEFLVAHVVPHTGQTLTAEELQQLAQSLPLPAYMRPSVMVALDRLPHTPSGKIDRRVIEGMALPVVEQPGSRLGNKLSLEEGELSLLWEEVLGQQAGLARANLKPSSDFFMLGGGSLQLMQLQGAIKETLGLAVPITQLYQNSTIGAMATHLHAEKGQQQPSEEINWNKETEFTALSSTTSTAAVVAKRDQREVLMTGSHTFLGAEILQALLADPSVSKVHCIAIPHKANAMKAPASSAKVVLYPGALQHPSLGLSASQAAMLSSRVDLILHAGSVGHCLNNYWSVRAGNLASLRFLLEIALPRHTPLHFVSSQRVTLLAHSTSLPPVSVSAHPPATDGSDGFTASKWAGEVLLENAARATGLPVVVHRPCAATGAAAPNSDALNALLRFSLLLRAVPRFDMFGGFFDFCDVGDVARQMARVALHGPSKGEGEGDGKARLVVGAGCGGAAESMVIAHHSSGIKTPVGQLRERMEEIHGGEFRELEVGAWIVEASREGLDPLIGSYLEAVIAQEHAIDFPFLGETERSEACAAQVGGTHSN